MSVINDLAKRFPQIYLKPETGVSQSEIYRAIIRRGEQYEGDLDHFIGSPEDSITVESTPAGEVSVVFLKQRADFECFYRIMAAKCEPIEIPPSIGATYIGGINDWSKIHAHMEEYRRMGGEDTKSEFSRFTSDSSNYKVAMILLSDGPYSALSCDKTPYGEDEWKPVSLNIRRYHELTHFVCRRLYPQKRNAVWDELLADCFGLLCATGSYDPTLAQAFLGIENGVYIGGRLESYLKTLPYENIVNEITLLTKTMADLCPKDFVYSKDSYKTVIGFEERCDELLKDFPLILAQNIDTAVK